MEEILVYLSRDDGRNISPLPEWLDERKPYLDTCSRGQFPSAFS